MKYYILMEEKKDYDEWRVEYFNYEEIYCNIVFTTIEKLKDYLKERKFIPYGINSFTNGFDILIIKEMEII